MATKTKEPLDFFGPLPLYTQIAVDSLFIRVVVHVFYSVGIFSKEFVSGVFICYTDVRDSRRLALAATSK